MVIPPKTLLEIATQHPFPDFQNWWNIGDTFAHFMSNAIVPEWRKLNGQLSKVQKYTAEYLQTVYQRQPAFDLVDNFVTKQFSLPLQSGEFDALSYAFYHSAFEQIASQNGFYGLLTPQARR